MKAAEKVFDPGTFDERSFTCPSCGWTGKGEDTNVADFYGLSKYKQVSCPRCDEYLGNLSREASPGGRSQEKDR